MKRYLINCNEPPLRLGDKVAMCYIAQALRKKRGYGALHIIDDAYILDVQEKQWVAKPSTFRIDKYFPDLIKDKLGNQTHHKNHITVPRGDYHIINPPNLWISAPSMFKDTGFVPEMTANTSEEFITVHGLYDAPYNKCRNMKKEQIDELVNRLKDAGLPVKEIPQIADGYTIEYIIDNYLAKSILCISGDTSMSHIAAALDKNIVAIYPNNEHDVKTYEPLRQQMRASSPWSSDPISTKYKKFEMQNNMFDIDVVFEYTVNKYREICKCK